jgi:hypothetical protein
LYNEFLERHSTSFQEKGFCLTRLFYRALRLKPCRKPLLAPLGYLVDHAFIIEFRDTYLGYLLDLRRVLRWALFLVDPLGLVLKTKPELEIGLD